MQSVSWAQGLCSKPGQATKLFPVMHRSHFGTDLLRWNKPIKCSRIFICFGWNTIQLMIYWVLLLRTCLIAIIPRFPRLTRTAHLYHRCLLLYNVVLTSRVHSSVKYSQQSTVTAADSCDGGISVLNHCLSWSKFVNTHLYHSSQWFDIHWWLIICF